jgi:CubicO group peptidase (beta-lactamase class C family)/D-alanyl-D-alanine dipeptidase
MYCCRHSRKSTLSILGVGFLAALAGGCVQPRPTVDTTGQSLAHDPLVDIAEYDPRMVVDVKYATADNFVGEPVYPIARCLLRKSAAQRLARVQDRLEADGYGLKIHDGYRPLSVQKRFWKIMPDPRYVADPRKGSRHNRGAAVDVTLVDACGGGVEMPTKYDDFTEAAHRNYAGGNETSRQNRDRLAAAMEAEGFKGLADEWWHYDAPGWEQLPLLDISLAAAPVSSETAMSDLTRARALADEGKFAEAERILRKHVPDPDCPAISGYAVELDILQRIRRDFRLSADQMLEKLRASIPDATAEDMNRWQQDGLLQHRVIDGEVCFFAREPGNLFRISEAAKARRVSPPERAGWSFSSAENAAHVLHLARQSAEPAVYPVKHHVTYTLTVNENHPRLKPGAVVRCWLPFPQEYRQQTDVRLIATDPPGGRVAENGSPHRTIYFEQTVTDPSKPPRFQSKFEFVTAAWCPHLDPAKVKPYDRASDVYRDFTAERPPHIVFTPEVRQIVAEVAAGEPNPLLRAQKLFRWIDANVPWCAEMEYSTIRSICRKGLAARRGDCGVQALTFITLCRVAGIPARWQSGWAPRPNDVNMHDWCEIYVEPWGWLPADPSYGLQKHDDPDVQTFFCGHMDPYRMIVNLDYAQPLSPAKISFRSESNDFQRGEIEIDGRNLYFGEWAYDFNVRTVPQEKSWTALTEALDAVVPDRLLDGNMSGAVIHVGRKVGNEYEEWSKAYGYMHFQPEPAPMPEDAIFDLASMSKPLATGTALTILIDEGKVGLDDPVSKYLPEFAEGDKAGVTVRNLMTHMSGLQSYVGAGEQKPIRDEHGFPCRDAIRRYIREIKPSRKPGEAVVYSCLNAILCAEIVRTVTGMEHSDFLAARVFKPLGMTDTGFNPAADLDPRIVPTTRTPYGRGPGGFLRGQVHDPLAAMQDGVSGNAGLFSTAANVARYAQMLLNDGELDGVRILSKDAIHLLTTPQNPGGADAKGNPDPRGLLWPLHVPEPGATGLDGIPFFAHTGYTGTAIRVYPEQGIYVIVLANRVHPDDKGQVGALRTAVWQTVGNILMGTAE